MSKAKKSRSAGLARKPGQLRIIGGAWRGRKFQFPAEPGLRPTGDRIRETLFNWLAPNIAGARCADLFAGSGALGLEALSRGAAHCDFVDSSNNALACLKEHLNTLGADQCALTHAVKAETFLTRTVTPFDIVFIDPPFHGHLVDMICAALEEHHLLNDNALIYIETGSDEGQPRFPDRWLPYKSKLAGGVSYQLYRASSPPAS